MRVRVRLRPALRHPPIPARRGELIMHRLRRLRLESIGHQAAGFKSIVLDLTGGVSSIDGRTMSAVDAILWLRNGGGKSSLMSLFFSLLLPRKDDFIGHKKNKSLADYVPDAQVSHVVLEWEDSARPEAGAVLVTGGVYQWKDGQKPADVKSGWERLERSWYIFRPQPGGLEMDSLPLRGETGQVSRTAFLRALQQANKEERRLRLVIAEEQYDWSDQLASHGLDPQIVKMQKRMNQDEGGITDLFQFPSCEDFIDFLIEMVVDERTPAAARSALTVHGDKLAARPARELENRFLAEALLRLRPVQRASEARSEAGFDLARSVRLASRAGEHITARAEQLGQEAEQLGRDAKAAKEEAAIAAQHAKEGHRAVVIGREAAERCALAERRREHEECERAKAGADWEKQAWAAVPLVLELAGQRKDLQDAQRLLEQLADQQAPLHKAMEAAGAAWSARLGNEQVLLDAELTAARLRQAEAKEQAQDADQERVAAANAAGRAQEQALTAVAHVEKVRVMLDSARIDGLLIGEEDPQQAVERLAEEEALVCEQRQSATDRTQEARALVDSVASERSESATRLAKVRDQHTAQWERLDELAGHHRELQNEPRLRELAQLEDDGPGANLDEIAGDLLSLLDTAIAEADTLLARERAGALQDERARDALEREGYLPASPHVEEAIVALRALGATQAISGIQYLRETVPAHRHDEVIAAIPHLINGVVVCGPVPGDDVHALARRAHVSLNTIVVVGTDSQARTLSAAGGRAAVLPLHPAVLDVEAGEQELRRVCDRLDSLDERLKGIVERRDGDRALSARVREHTAVFGPGTRGELEDCLGRLDAEIDDLTLRLSDLSRQAGQADEVADQAERAVRASTQRLIELAGLLPRARDLAAAADDACVWEAQARTARGEAREHHDAVIRLAASCQDAQERAGAEGREIKRCEDAAQRWERELKTLRQHVPDHVREATATGEVSADSLEALQHRWTQAFTDWHNGISDSDLRERVDRCRKEITRIHTELEGAKFDLGRAEELAREPDASDVERRAARIEAAGAAYESARDAVVRAEVLCDQAHASHRTAQAALDGLVPPPHRAEFASETEARQALTAAEESCDAAEKHGAAKTLEAERIGRSADQAAGTARELLQSAVTLQTAATRSRETLGEAETSGEENLTVDAALSETHGLGPTTAHQLTSQTAEGIATSLTREADAASRRYTQASKALDKAVRQVDQLAADPHYLTVVDGRLRARLQQDVASPTRLSELIEDVAVREREVCAVLAELADDRAKVVEACAGLVEAVLDDLEEVSRHSTLPQGLGTWSGQRFLSLEIRHRAQGEELARRIAMEVDRMTAAVSPDSAGKSNALPDALPLTQRLVLAALGGRGNVIAKIVKPGQNLDSVNRESVTEIQKFSGGELLTVSVLLYCTLARMRAAKRHGSSGGGVGTLLLDNPFGKANYGPFIALQRRVAGAHGIQLVYTTGSNDLPALGRFPLIIRMRNDVDLRTRRRYVQIIDQFGDAVSDTVSKALADGISSARLLRRAEEATETGDETPEAGEAV
ncbi:hypothetical protein [Streptomyces sp. H34-S4]|uniref:hypothetical protein n=1 Tax=Streptomyces sp. H34-S4 TaxID=2996463 RepID=UPI002271B9D5|nr:hypothetical protein [Streptomyces sp. H34-S4]MCY0933856.1 hypothetical protein [Streptomyces sp. H34-S4]